MTTVSPAGAFTLLGTGNSTGVPWLHCVLSPASRCEVCQNCLDDPSSPNVRNNPSALVSVPQPDGSAAHVLIDVGKTFRETMLKQLPRLGVSRVAAVILTHPHADAMGGLDDLRDLAPGRPLTVYVNEATYKRASEAFAYLMPAAVPASSGLFVAQIKWQIMRPWEPFVVEGTGGLVCTPFPVAHGEPGSMFGFDFQWVEAGANGSGGGAQEEQAAAAGGAAAEPMCCPADAVASPLPTDPGAAGAYAPPAAHPHPPCSGSPPPPPLPVLALPSRAPARRVVYVSDCSGLPSEARDYIAGAGEGTVLVLDALARTPYPTHFSLQQALAAVLDCAPEAAVFTGLGHRVDYRAETRALAAWKGAVWGRRGGGSQGSNEGDEPPCACAAAWPAARPPPSIELGRDGLTIPFVPARSRDVLSVASAAAAVPAAAAADGGGGPLRCYLPPHCPAKGAPPLPLPLAPAAARAPASGGLPQLCAAHAAAWACHKPLPGGEEEQGGGLCGSPPAACGCGGHPL